MKKSLTAIMLIALIIPVPTVAVFEDDEVVEEVVVTATRERQTVWTFIAQSGIEEEQALRESARLKAEAARALCEKTTQDALAAGATAAFTVAAGVACTRLGDGRAVLACQMAGAACGTAGMQ